MGSCRNAVMGLCGHMYIYLPIAEISVNALVLLGLGGLVGVLSGMFGVGGGFLMTPLLFFIGIPPAVAVATEANQIVASSFSGVLAHVKRRNVDFKMGGVLLIGGLVGAGVGVFIFNYLKGLGQVDLLVKLCYVVFLGIVGSLMFTESLQALRKSKQVSASKLRKQRTWIHALPLKIRFRVSGLYISAIPPGADRPFGRYFGSYHGCWRRFCYGPRYDLSLRHADQSSCWHLTFSNYLCNGFHNNVARDH